MASRADLLRKLNPQQHAAATHAAGPLLVIAGAGTGKTKTLAARVGALLQAGADPGRILLLTFTRRAAGEMIRRAASMVGQAATAGVWNGTFHAVSYRLLCTYSQALGLRSNLVILDQGDAEDLMNLIRTDLGLHRSATRFPRKSTLLSIYSRCINNGQPLDQVLAERFPWCESHHGGIKRVFEGYAERKEQRGLLDYDDLLLYWEQALDTPQIGTALARRFQHLLIDEYQDTNELQGAILQKLWRHMVADSATPAASDAPAPRSIMVVGDDAQSIYSFRGATVENILRFPDQFPGTTIVTLEQNYRSVTPILDASNAVMSQAQRGYAKNLWSQRSSPQKPVLVTCADEMDQCRVIIERILQHREEGVPLTGQAVLFRAGHNSDMLEVELARHNIPFVKWGGLRFLEAAHVKDMLAFLRILENPQDELSWMRVLQLLDGIGPGRARQVVNEILQSSDIPAALRAWRAPATAREQVEALAGLLAELMDADPELPVPAQIERIRSFYEPILDQHYDQPEMRERDLVQLEILAQQATSRANFLADLTLDPPVSTGDLAGPPLLDEEYVVLSTIHSAKGCEWSVVYLTHAADGVLPSDMCVGEAELEEERRLLYVAMTRAKDRLYVTFPLRYYHRKHALGDGHSFAQLSRFLPPSVLPLFEQQSHSSTREDLLAMAEPAVPVAAGVQARVKRLWG